MKVFLAGGSGAIGRLLVPMLVEAGYEVVAMTRSPERAASLGDMLVYIMNEQRGASNAKANRVLRSQPRVRSWRDG